jgi:hypothetical protein
MKYPMRGDFAVAEKYLAALQAYFDEGAAAKKRAQAVLGDRPMLTELPAWGGGSHVIYRQRSDEDVALDHLVMWALVHDQKIIEMERGRLDSGEFFLVARCS